MTESKSASRKIARLLSHLSDELLTRPDQELLSEVRAEGVDVIKHASVIRGRLQKRLERSPSPVGTSLVEATVAVYETDRKALSDGHHPGTSSESSFVNWTSKSVARFAKGRDPLVAIKDRAQELVVRALEAGWTGPPYDPFKLADLLRIKVVPRADIAEARTVSGPHGEFVVEFNPQRPSSRTRFSIAHEIVHTFFDDCLERARYRARRSMYRSDDWQLELLCNVGAAEILMPTGSFSSLKQEGFDIARLMDLRRELGVSAEAVLLRATKLAKTPMACFVASNRRGPIRPDYIACSDAWNALRQKSVIIPESTLLERCSAIGFISKGDETWSIDGRKLQVDVQSVGLPAYVGQEHLRVAGLVRPRIDRGVVLPSVEYIDGNALEPIGEGRKLVAHVVNDATPRWGGRGIAASMKSVWPSVQNEFKQWATANKQAFRLGSVHIAALNDEVSVASMVAQHGYGPSERPRIRYASLESCLVALADFAERNECSIHMPKIGAGQGQGNWGVIEELVERLVCGRGIRAFVYQFKESKLGA